MGDVIVRRGMCPAVFSFGRAEIQEKEKGNQGMNIFEILGPVMVGPSSSHTAGAVRVQASSLGGGRIMVNQIDGIRVDFTGEKPTLIIQNEDKPGVLAAITYTLSAQDVNIATLQLYRDGKGGSAFIIAETDSDLGEEVLCELREKKGVLKVIRISSEEER